MEIIKSSQYETYRQRRKQSSAADPAVVRNILAEVRADGDAAVKKYTLQFDGVTMDQFKIDKQTCTDALNAMGPEVRTALQEAASNLKQFALLQLEQMRDFRVELQPGVFTGQRIVPLKRVGVYVPGGNFPLVSSLLMGAVPARAAGVDEIVVCTPPGPNGQISPAIAAAAAVAGVDEVYAVGGIQAVGAMAYGTESIQAVDKITGPGNRYVAAAKKEVYGTVGIDFTAGPSEVMIIADAAADPAWIAADLLAQAEHDADAVSILVTPSIELARQVQLEIKKQLTQLSTKEIAGRSIRDNGCIVLTETVAEAVAFADGKAPEHLELQVAEPQDYVPLLRNYGSLFIGAYAAEVLGDYSSGLNHTLPTSGAARYTGGLSVRDFVKVLTTLETTAQGLKSIGKTAFVLAGIEGLHGHGEAVRRRMTES